MNISTPSSNFKKITSRDSGNYSLSSYCSKLTDLSSQVSRAYRRQVLSSSRTQPVVHGEGGKAGHLFKKYLYVVTFPDQQPNNQGKFSDSILMILSDLQYEELELLNDPTKQYRTPLAFRDRKHQREVANKLKQNQEVFNNLAVKEFQTEFNYFQNLYRIQGSITNQELIELECVKTGQSQREVELRLTKAKAYESLVTQVNSQNITLVKELGPHDILSMTGFHGCQGRSSGYATFAAGSTEEKTMYDMIDELVDAGFGKGGCYNICLDKVCDTGDKTTGKGPGPRAIQATQYPKAPAGVSLTEAAVERLYYHKLSMTGFGYSRTAQMSPNILTIYSSIRGTGEGRVTEQDAEIVITIKDLIEYQQQLQKDLHAKLNEFPQESSRIQHAIDQCNNLDITDELQKAKEQTDILYAFHEDLVKQYHLLEPLQTTSTASTNALIDEIIAEINALPLTPAEINEGLTAINIIRRDARSVYSLCSYAASVENLTQRYEAELQDILDKYTHLAARTITRSSFLLAARIITGSLFLNQSKLPVSYL